MYTLKEYVNNTRTDFIHAIGRPDSYNNSGTHAAFTLAEVLITLAVIGVVAVLTLPGLIQNHNDKALATAQTVFLRRFQEAAKQMNADGQMTGYSTTEAFVNEFKNYMKNMQICEAGKNEKCFAKTINIPNGQETVTYDTTELRTAGNFSKDFDTNIIGYSLPNGMSMLLTYNPDCAYIDPYDSNADPTQCVSMLYDVNGKKKPNEQGRDIFTLNGVQLSVQCSKYNSVAGLSVACEDINSWEPLNTCDQYSEIAIGCDTDYSAGAAKACEDIGMRLPSISEFEKIATYIYHQEDSPISGEYTGTMDTDRMTELGFGMGNLSMGQCYFTSDGTYIADDEVLMATRFCMRQEGCGTMTSDAALGPSRFGVKCVK